MKYPGLYVGRIAPCVLNRSIIILLYHGNYGRTWTSEVMKNRGRLMPGLNNMPSHGYPYESNAIYSEEIHPELMEFYTSRLFFLMITDRGNIVSKCQVQVIVGLRPPTGLGKIWKNAYHARRSVADTYVWVLRNNVKNSSRYTRFYPFILPNCHISVNSPSIWTR